VYISSRLNRIFLLPAVISMIPGYPVGENVYREMFRTEVYGKSIELYSYPPDWQCKLAGAATALLAFVIVFLGLRLCLKLALGSMGKFRGLDRRFHDRW
jgi:hypothetical protein